MGAGLPQPVQVLVTDVLNRPAANRVVNFSVLTGGGSTTNTTTTDASGHATATWQLGTVALSSQTLEARVLTPAGTRKSVAFTAIAVAGAPDTITAVAGTSLSAAAGTPVRTLPSVRLADEYGNLVAGHTVNFVVTQGGGTVQTGAPVSNAMGVATVGGWTLGAAQGPNALTATAQGTATGVVFQATGTSPVASQVAVLTEPTGALVSGTTLGQQPAVQVANASGDPILEPNISVTASVADGAGGATLTGTVTATTDANGTATFTNLGLAGTVGSYTLDFTAAGLAPDTSGAIALSAGPATTMIDNVGTHQSVNAGSSVPTAPSVQITDDWGNGIGGIGVSFSVTAGNGLVTGGAATTGPNGVATVGSWQLGSTSGPNALTATAQHPGLAGNPVVINATALGNFWSPRAAMPVPRRFTAWAANLGLLYAVGGRDGALNVRDTVEVYNPVANAWSGRRAMTTERVGASAGFIQGKLYVAGGNPQGGVPITTTEVYSPNNTWAFVAALPTERNFSAFTVINDKLYLAGGGNSAGQIKTTVVYDPLANQWTALADLPDVRNDAVAVAHNGLMYVIGGQVLNTVDGALLVYDPQANSWTPLAPMPTPRYHANAEVLNGKIYVISGLLQGAVASTVVEVYDIEANTWSTAAPITTARSAAAIAVIDGVIYVAGGSANNTVTGVVEAYVP